MRAQIRELITPAMLLAGILVSVRPSLAADVPGRFVAHTNQDGHQKAHSNQVGAARWDALKAVEPALPLAGVDLGTERGWRPASAIWVPQSMPIDAGARVPADTDLGLGSEALRGARLPSAGVAARGGAPAGAIPAPGGLGLLVLVAVAGRRRRRGGAPTKTETGRREAAGAGRAGCAGGS
jgi:hypothetical protein